MATRDRQTKVTAVAGQHSTPGMVFHDKKFGTFAGPACPKCGGPMVLRTSWGARIGTWFWGCARYPRCCATITTS
jgi:hypothetical protein